MTLLLHSSTMSTNPRTFVSLLALTNLSGAVGVLSTLAGSILIEREWYFLVFLRYKKSTLPLYFFYMDFIMIRVVVISEGHSPEKLARMNSAIRRIDLTCNLGAPVITGFIISFVSLKASAIALALWNLVSVWLEYWLFVSVYKETPALQESSQRRASRSTTDERKNSFSRHDINIDDIPKRNWATKLVVLFFNVPYLKAWAVYLRQDVVLPGIALALLFFTVLR